MHVLGVILAVFLFGLSSVRISLNISNLVRERLPVRARTVVTLPRRRHRVLLQPRRSTAGVRLGLTYLGLTDGVPQCRVDVQYQSHVHHLDIAVAGHWDARTLLARLPAPRPSGIDLTLETLEATPESVRLRVSTGMRLTYEGGWDTVGLSPSDVLTLPEAQRQVVNWILRQGEVSLAQVAAHCRQPADEHGRRAAVRHPALRHGASADNHRPRAESVGSHGDARGTGRQPGGAAGSPHGCRHAAV